MTTWSEVKSKVAAELADPATVETAVRLDSPAAQRGWTE